MLRLDTHANIRGVTEPLVLKVMTLEEFITGSLSPHQVALWVESGNDNLDSLLKAPWGGVFCPDTASWQHSCTRPLISAPRDASVVVPGDVISLFPGNSLVKVLFRKSSTSNALFITERCNNNCVMCSQPPRDVDDRWRFEINHQLLRLIDKDIPWLGITGGEPTLDQNALVNLINTAKELLPHTGLHVLTHGRTFGTSDLAPRIRQIRHPRIQWGVPLYGDVSEIHDGVVRVPGAFDETVEGLLALGRAGQAVELRMVLQKATIPRLRQFAYWVSRNLSFVECVAFMGLEPMGYARTNRTDVWVDPVDYMDTLEASALYLQDRGIRTYLYNIPYCVATPPLTPLLQQSISDWKNAFLPQCELCSVRQRCSGFFASAKGDWISRGISPILDLEKRR